MLLADGILGRETGDGKRVIEDIDSALSLSRQLAGNNTLLLNLLSLSISEMALDQIEQTLREQPTLIRNQDWIALATRLSAPKVAADLITIESERMSFDDLLQRTFTDDDSGNGRLTADGVNFFLGITHNQNGWLKRAAAPAAGLFVASRQKLKDEYTHTLDGAEANLKLPLRNADWSSVQKTSSFSAFPIRLITPVYPRVQAAAERFLGRRDGIVTAIALELFRRQHGTYPETLNALVPEFLREVPVDRITGMPLHYRLAAGQPLLYSVGANRKDDGGRYILAPQQAANWEDKSDELPELDWVLYPTLKQP